jgi:hypothetical protein
MPLLQPGAYVITAERPGFAAVEVRDVVLSPDDYVVLKIRLSVESVRESVTVRAAPRVLESAGVTRVATSPAVTTVIHRQFIANLPLNGRSFQSLFELTPGVVITQTSFEEQGQFSVNGQRANANYLTVDGVSANVGASSTINMGQSAAGGLPGLTALGGTNNLVSVDALQEFRIHTSSYAPEFGRTPGAQISLVTRSGGNAYHGSASEYFRHDALDANDWFANRAGLPKPRLRQNNFGAVLGGPVFRGKENRTFFFASYEGLRLRQPNTVVDGVPTLEARAAAAPELRPFLDAYPVPNGAPLGNGLAEFAATYSNPSRLDAFSLRVDHRTQNLTVFFRANVAPSETYERGGQFTLSTNSRVEKDTGTFTGGATLIAGPRISNDLRVNYSVARGAAYFDVDTFGGAVKPSDSLLFPGGADPDDALFSFGFLSGPQFFVGKNADNRQRQVNVVNTLSWPQGRHHVKVGADYRQMLPTNSPRSRDLFVFFNNVPSTVRDSVVYASVGATDTLPMSLLNFSVFAQDTWAATKRLTLTYGLRWDVNPPPSARGGRELYTVEGIDDPANLRIAPAGTRLWKTHLRDIAPRVGLAYRLFDGSARPTVIRAGAGTFYDMLGHTFGSGVSLFPYSRITILSGQSFPFPPSLVTPPAFTTDPPVEQMFAVDPAIVTPRVYQWNIAVEQILGPQTVTVSYVGAAGRQLLRQEMIAAPNPDFGAVSVTRNTAESDYKALQVQVRRRLTRGLQALASYTLASSKDNASNDSTQNTPGDRIDPRADWGPSSFDVRHAFTSALTVNLPGPQGAAAFLLRGWALDAVFRARSATPVNVVASGSLFGVSGLLRADLVPNEPLYVDDPSAPGGRRINRDAFAVPAPGRQGTLGRNALRGFPMSQLDLAVRRQFRVTGGRQLQLRLEAFNVLNRPNFANPMSYITSGQFGLPGQMLGRGLGTGGFTVGFNPLYQLGGPRSMQLAARFTF